MLQAYLINNTPAHTELKSYLIEELNGNSPIICEDELQTGYIDITSIENWHMHGSVSCRDFKYIREQIKTLMFNIAGNDLSSWSELSEEEAKICCQYMLVPKSIRDLYYTNIEQLKYSNMFYSKVTKSRENRYRYLMMFLYNNLTLEECQGLVNNLRYVSDGNKIVDLINNYIFYGIEGTEKGDSAALYDFIQSTVGTIFETTGLSSLNLTSWSGTIPELVTQIMDIIENGNYDKDVLEI